MFWDALFNINQLKTYKWGAWVPLGGPLGALGLGDPWALGIPGPWGPLGLGHPWAVGGPWAPLGLGPWGALQGDYARRCHGKTGRGP